MAAWVTRIRTGFPCAFTGQHFAINRNLVADAIRFVDVRRDDLVLDIGNGCCLVIAAKYWWENGELMMSLCR